MTRSPGNDTGPGAQNAHRGQHRALAEAAAESTDRRRGFPHDGPRFDYLLVGHDPRRSAEESLTLAAMAAVNGLRADGSPMPAAQGAAPASIASIARELGLHVGAARRGVTGNLAIGEADRDGAGYRARPEALALRWADGRRRIRLDKAVRGLELRAEPLLLAGLVLGQSDRNGRVVLGRQWLAERLGWVVQSGRTAGRPARRLDVARAAAERAGAIHTWTIPGSWQFCLAPGPSRTRNREATRTRNREADAQADHREPATPTIANPQRGASRTRNETTANPQQLPGLPSGLTSGSPPDAPAPPAGDPIPPPQQQNAPAARQQQSLGVDELRNRAGAWAVEMAARGVERLIPAIHSGDVAALLAALGADPEAVRDADALARARRDAARRIAMWCPQPERLARWCVVAAIHYDARNLSGLVRVAAERGDPGTLLERHAGGDGALLPEHEAALQGAHAERVAQLGAGSAGATTRCDDSSRARLRAELARCLGAGRRDGARRVLLCLVGDDRSDLAIARAVDGLLSVDAARELLAA